MCQGRGSACSPAAFVFLFDVQRSQLLRAPESQSPCFHSTKEGGALSRVPNKDSAGAHLPLSPTKAQRELGQSL